VGGVDSGYGGLYLEHSWTENGINWCWDNPCTK